MPKLIDGSINAVLSSGDGGAGRKLWEYLPCFSEITYSLPLSIASVNQAAYDGLSPDTRAAVDAASRQTESELWRALSTRLEENYQRMRQNGVAINSNPEPSIVAALRTGAAAAQRAWCTRAGPVCAEILDAFKAATNHSAPGCRCRMDMTAMRGHVPTQHRPIRFHPARKHAFS